MIVSETRQLNSTTKVWCRSGKAVQEADYVPTVPNLSNHDPSCFPGEDVLKASINDAATTGLVSLNMKAAYFMCENP